MPRKIEISYKTIVFAVLFLLSLWLLYFIRDIILALFVAVLIMTILNPLVSKMTKIKIPRALAILICYVIVLGIFGVTLALIIPPLVDQTTEFANNLPKYLSNLGIAPSISQQVVGQLLNQLGALPGQIIKFGVSFFSNILSVITVLIFAFYLLLVRDKLDEQMIFWVGEEKKKNFARIMDSIEKRLGGWARGELILMLAIGIFSFLGLTLLGIPFALPLAILSGLMEIIPYFGPIISAIPTIIIGLSISPIMGMATIALALLVHQSENYILVPKIMEKSVGVPPLATLIALAVGFRLLGVVGAVISVPVVITGQIFISEYLQNRE
jgi:predicted PurR-regulated permease PerM